MILTIRPVSGWTGPRTPPEARKRHNFTRQKSSGWGRVDIPWSETLLLLDRELARLRPAAAPPRRRATRHGEQYKGWLQLEAGTSNGMPTSRAQAAEVLSRISGVHIDADESKQSATARWKAARAIAHPDRNNGARDLWDQVEAAGQLLGLST